MLTDDELNVVGARVDAFYRKMGRRTADTPLTYDEDERVLGDISAFLRELDRLDRRHHLAGGSIVDPIHFRLRNSTDRMYPIENLFAYSQALCAAADIDAMLHTYVDHIVERDRALAMNEPATLAFDDDKALGDRFFCKYIVGAAPVMQGYTPRLYGTAAAAHIVAMIDELTDGRYADTKLRIEHARRIAEYTVKIHAYYAEHFQITPTSIAHTPRFSAARVLFASWQDLGHLNQVFPNDAIIERALQNASIGDEIVARYAQFVDTLEYCASDMRAVLSTAELVAQQTTYMHLTQEQREHCVEIGKELRVLAMDVKLAVRSPNGYIFYHGPLKKKYNQLIFDDLKIAIERYSCEFV
jgi:hypothetical protein